VILKLISCCLNPLFFDPQFKKRLSEDVYYLRESMELEEGRVITVSVELLVCDQNFR